jgi:hypothetical protein
VTPVPAAPRSGEVAPVDRRRDAVQPGDQLERLGEGEVPPELAALAEDDADVERVALALPPGDQAVHFDLPGGRHQDAGQHLDRGGLAGAVGAEVADQLALLDVEADAVDRAGDGVLPGEEGAHPAEEARPPPRGTELFHQVPDPDD